MEGIAKALAKILGNGRVKTKEPMSRHTTFRTGGPAAFFAEPSCAEELAAAVRTCAEYEAPYYILGNGSNVIVKDDGFEGVVISTLGLNKIELSEEASITAEAGARLRDAAMFALERELTGFEFAGGIPGSVGGAVYMNAGAYGGEMKNVFVSGEVLFDDLSIRTVDNAGMAFGYRSSALNAGGILLRAEIRLSHGNGPEIKGMMDELIKKRNASQPMDLPSAGSAFKRPPGDYAGRLIAESGLKGFSIGGARVSEKHAGFIVNSGGAAASDILKLIEHVQKTVFSKFGISLEPEIKIL